MDQFNKALSFILGLVVVAVFIVVASGKLKLGGLKFPQAGKSTAKISTTPTPKPTSKPLTTLRVTPMSSTSTVLGKKAPTPTISYTYHSYSGNGTPTSIPNTGVPIVLFPLMGSGLLSGIFLKSKGKK